MTTRPLFSATIAGSLPKPAWLSETQKLWPQWKAGGAEPGQAKADATIETSGHLRVLVEIPAFHHLFVQVFLHLGLPFSKPHFHRFILTTACITY